MSQKCRVCGYSECESQNYYVNVGYIYNTADGIGEKQMEIKFKTKNQVEAVKAGIKWAKNRLPIVKLFIDTSPAEAAKVKIGSIKIGNYNIYTPEKNGLIHTSISLHFFEWKIDFPTSLADELKIWEGRNPFKD